MIDVHVFVQVYNFCFEGGGIYTPTDRDRAMIEDAINCYVAECEQAQAELDEAAIAPQRIGHVREFDTAEELIAAVQSR